MKEKFILPECWAIKQDRKEINAWLNIHKQTNSNYDSINSRHFAHYPAYNKYHLHSEIRPGYTEITFEEFEIGVLKTRKYKPVDPSELETIYKRLLA
jgi:hypothetical protein